MAIEVETLLVRLEARITDFEKNLAKAQRKAQETSNHISSTFASANARVSRVLGMLGVGLSLGAITAFIRKTVELGSTISDLSQRLGISAEQFQELSFIASQTATSQDAVVASFRGMTQFMAAAAKGSKDQVATLKLLGLTFDDLKRKSPVAVFQILLDRAGKIQNPLQRAAALAALFGRQGASMGAVALLGAAGFEALRNKAHDVGAVMTNETINALDKTGDKLDELSRSVGTAGGELVEKLLPAIEGLVNAFTDPKFQSALKSTLETLAGIVTFLVQHPELVGILGGAAVGGRVGGVPGAVIGGIAGAAKTAPPGQFRPPFMGPSPDISQLQGSREQFDLNRELGITARVAPPAAAGVAAVGAAAAGAAPPVGRVATNTSEVATSVEELIKLFPDLFDEFEGLGDVSDAAADKAARVAADLAFEAQQLRRNAREQAVFNAVNQAGIDIHSKLGAAIAAQAGANYDLSLSVQQNVARFNELRDTATEVFSSIVDGIRQGKEAGEILGTVIDNIATKLANAGIDQLVAGLLGATGTAGGGSLGTIISALFGGFRDGGGPVTPGRAYVVGEKRPELFVPNVSGHIMGSNGGAGGGRHMIELVLTPEADARIRRVAGPQSRDISIAVVKANAKQSGRQQELNR